MSSTLNHYFEDYDRYHQNPLNILCHYFGIPLIVISLFGLLSQIQLPTPFINGGSILWITSSLYYMKLSWRLGLLFSLLTLFLLFLSTLLSTSILWSLFALGWFLQFLGHLYFEKNSPAFGTNLVHLLIGPLWIFAKLLKLKNR